MKRSWQIIISMLANLLFIPLIFADTISKDAATTSFFKRANSYATHPESEPPRYVRNLSQTGINAFKDITWLDVGLDYRMRYEYRNNDLRRLQIATDNPILLRSRLYLGVKEILDPLRLVAEFEDARRYNGDFPRNRLDTNEFELIQSYAELYFKKLLGHDDLGNHRPLRIRAGRMAWESVDRRLFGRNEWRNTTNNFEGFRVNLGQQHNNWELDLWGVQLVMRLLNKFDERDKDQWFYGAILNWRQWSDIITLQPYYMGLMQKGTAAQLERRVHSPALRGFGTLPNTNIDFDFGAVYQFGSEGSQRKSAWAYLAEVGYTFNHAWKPRVSAFYGFASGDRNPNDNVDNRFEHFFGFGRPWSADNYLIFENVSAPKIKLEFQPLKDLQIDGGYNWFWLASDTDRFRNLLDNTDNNRDSTGNSGNFIGHAFDIRLSYQLTSRINTLLGFSHFSNGEFVRNRQESALGRSSEGTNFFYFQVLINAFK